MTTALEEGEESASHPGRSLPPGKTRYPLYRRPGGTQGRSGQAREISPPPEFDPRTVQPVASRDINYATRPTTCYNTYIIFEQAMLHSISENCDVPSKLMVEKTVYFLLSVRTREDYVM